MTSQLRITRVLAISSCLWAALALTQRTQAQATPDPDPQLQDCYTVHPPDPNDLQPPQDEPNWNGRFQAYSDLIIAAVSDEDHQKFGALQDDLSKGLGITIEEDRAVRQIFVDAQRRGRLAWKCWADLQNQVRFTKPTPAQQATLDELSSVQPLVYKAAIMAIHRELSEGTFLKVDKYAYTVYCVGKSCGFDHAPYPGNSTSGGPQ